MNLHTIYLLFSSIITIHLIFITSTCQQPIRGYLEKLQATSLTGVNVVEYSHVTNSRACINITEKKNIDRRKYLTEETYRKGTRHTMSKSWWSHFFLPTFFVPLMTVSHPSASTLGTTTSSSISTTPPSPSSPIASRVPVHNKVIRLFLCLLSFSQCYSAQRDWNEMLYKGNSYCREFC